MIARLFVREVGAREFSQHNGEFADDPILPGASSMCGETRALEEGERLCREGNVEAFQVWTLAASKQRVWGLEDIG